MIPVFQTRFASPDDPALPPGNCFAACIASILEISLDEVPWPTSEERGGDGWADYMQRLSEWLACRGLAILDAPLPRPWCSTDALEASPLIWIAGGLSPRGSFSHAVVCRGPNMIHDPHPSGEGIVTDSAHTATLILPIDMAEWSRVPGVSG